MSALECAAAEEKVFLCGHCRRAPGIRFFDDRWLCAPCRGILERRLVWRELAIIAKPQIQEQSA